MPNEGDKQWLSLACIPKEPCICVNNDLNPSLFAIGPLPLATGPKSIPQIPLKIGQHPMEHACQGCLAKPQVMAPPL